MALKAAVLISGRGSNLQALIDSCAKPDFPARISLVLSNRADAQGLQRAQAAGIPTQVIPHRDYKSRAEFEVALDAAIKASGADLVCLAGFMRVLESGFVDAWRDRLINIHPSLLPLYPGLHTHERALAAGDQKAGCTVHYVRSEVDSGPLIVQASVPVKAGDTPDSLSARVLTAEHKAYPLALQLVAEGRIKIANEQTIIDGKPGPLRLELSA